MISKQSEKTLYNIGLEFYYTFTSYNDSTPGNLTFNVTFSVRFRKLAQNSKYLSITNVYRPIMTLFGCKTIGFEG
ncbi:hypothetical protein EB796_008886 [Bugula neritina]|uniref:Uncharacterized protein n=1 Tax=Bugula neritina TaxID=10212 RepID=A0A7J7K4E2_BUGNE|nr:hypothetical protein EB796_008886 [Bugula neritina]